MATAYSPSRSQWAPNAHGIDHNGYPASPSSGNAFAAADISTDSKATSRQRRGSSPGKRALQWFTRSRSTSPAAAAGTPQQQQQPGDHSFDPPSPSSFVVRSVVKQPGGVSHEYDAYGNIVSPSSYDSQAYQQMKSQPLRQIQPRSLIVPPGGPGGGTGYGTAKSTNDGRPERAEEAVERGRSRSKSPSRPASPGATTAGAFRSVGSPNTGRVSPGPRSNMQVAQFEEQARIDRHEAMRRSRQNSFNDTQNGAFRAGPTPPQSAMHSGPRAGPFAGATGALPSPRQSSPLAAHVAGTRPDKAFSMPVHIPKGSAPPPIIPLNGIPSPVKIGFSPNQAAAAHSPLGSVSPAGSPGFFDQNNPMQLLHDGSQPNSPNTASRWFKGLFGKSPRNEERDDGMYTEGGGNADSFEGQWLRSGSSPMSQQNAHAWSDGTPLAGQRREIPDAIEAEAAARKKHSMMMAARIEDEHRQRLMRGGAPPPPIEKNWVQRAEEPTPLSPPQSRSPPGRKPAPRFTAADLTNMSQKEREQVAREVDPDDRLSKLEGHLTPAQQIIAETRSKMAVTNSSAKDIRAADGRRSSTTSVQRGFELDKGNPQKEEAGVRRRGETNVESAQPAGKKAVNGLAAGSGPMPLDMPLGQAMQEMMIRFYKFERYAVPLMRSLEGRLVDVERDNQMALNHDGMSASSGREREMDKWVGQMTGLMRHEVGQLQAATREIRQAREILAAVVSNKGVAHAAVTKEGVTAAVAALEETHATSRSEQDTVAELPSKAQPTDARRQTNISSSTFNSAVQRSTPAESTQARRPSPVMSNASPNGRLRYTSALGKPMQQSHISPLPSSPVPAPIQAAPAAPSSPTPSAQSNVTSSSRRAMSVDDRLKALMAAKAGRSASMTTSMNEGRSSLANSHASRSSNGSADSGSSSDNTSFEKLSLPMIPSDGGKIGDDYQSINAFDAPIEQRSGHEKTESALSTRTTTTLKPDDVGQSLAAPRTAVGPAPVSPNMTGNSLRLAAATPPTLRQRSSSPIDLAACASPSSAIKTASHASVGLRARAQSYLQNADSAAGSSPLVPSPSAAGHSSPAALSSPSKLTSSVSSGVLRSRNVNNLDSLNAAAASLTTARSASAEEMVVRPLSIKKTGSSIKSSPVKPLLSAAVASLPASVKSLPASNAASPARMSIKDRVAFFDAAQQRAS